MGIVEFLRARLDEDEAVAAGAATTRVRVGAPEYWTDGPVTASASRWATGSHVSDEQRIEDGDGEVVVYDEGSPTTRQARHIARHDPDRVFAEVTGKRLILEVHGGWHVCPSGGGPAQTDYATDQDGMDPCPTLCHLATIYADHADYNAEWEREGWRRNWRA